MGYNIFTVFILQLLYLTSGLCDNSNTTCEFGYYYDGFQCADCGVSIAQPNVRIIGGTRAVKGSWPAQVLITQTVEIQTPEENFTNTFMCGGTLIGSDTILTAAHCIARKMTFGYTQYQIQPTVNYPTLESTFTVYLGAHNISFMNTNTDPPPDVVVSRVSQVIVHPLYNTSTKLNDIALLILNQSIVPTEYIKIACLPEKNTEFPVYGQSVFVSGWGTQTEGEPDLPDILQNVKLTVYDPSNCSNVSSGLPKNWDSQICAGKYSGGKDTCQGDSGGGLMVRQVLNGRTKYIVSGLVSYGVGCGRAGLPGIYTRTSYYIDWIKDSVTRREYSSIESVFQNSGRRLLVSLIPLIFASITATYILQFML